MRYYKLEVYVPVTHAAAVKQAIAAAGAGKLGAYDSCIWETAGTGQFRPLPGSNPFVGAELQLESVAESKLETICAAERLADVLTALRASHPYETPAFQYWPVELEG